MLEITIVNNIMQYTWDNEWKAWAEFQNDQDVKKTIADAEQLLTDSSKTKSKDKHGRRYVYRQDLVFH